MRSGRDAGVSPALKEESSRKRARSPVDRDDRGVLDSSAVLSSMLEKAVLCISTDPCYNGESAVYMHHVY